MTNISDRVESIIWAFDSTDSRRGEIREIAAEVKKLEEATLDLADQLNSGDATKLREGIAKVVYGMDCKGNVEAETVAQLQKLVAYAIDIFDDITRNYICDFDRMPPLRGTTQMLRTPRVEGPRPDESPTHDWSTCRSCIASQALTVLKRGRLDDEPGPGGMSQDTFVKYAKDHGVEPSVAAQQYQQLQKLAPRVPCQHTKTAAVTVPEGEPPTRACLDCGTEIIGGV